MWWQHLRAQVVFHIFWKHVIIAKFTKFDISVHEAQFHARKNMRSPNFLALTLRRWCNLQVDIERLPKEVETGAVASYINAGLAVFLQHVWTLGFPICECRFYYVSYGNACFCFSDERFRNGTERLKFRSNHKWASDEMMKKHILIKSSSANEHDFMINRIQIVRKI